ncbi:(2Fe-2S)-binding protein [Emcibacter sp.]|uniref:(2Fe-2S)-binding protein n=1 Tax=Emcibacter sp. TaxID=1979954 RepID=UPI002AA88D09|nr:(2Fe-2S)-binding protein [Emcibacter sp.]
MLKLTINNQKVSFDGDGEMPLLWYLREHFGALGVKFGCGIGECGACTVHINGDALRSCSLPMDALEDGAEITTIEGLAKHNSLHPVQQAWIELDVPQCGYCQAGQIMAVSSFLKDHPTPTDADIDANITNICRCGTYTRIRKAIHRAAILMREKVDA